MMSIAGSAARIAAIRTVADLPIEKAVNRAIARFRDPEEGRLVDPEYVLSVEDRPARRYANDVLRGSPSHPVEDSGGERSGGGQGPTGGGSGTDIRGSRRDHGQDPARVNAPSAGRDQGAEGPTLGADGVRGNQKTNTGSRSRCGRCGAGRGAGHGRGQTLSDSSPSLRSIGAVPAERQMDTSVANASIGKPQSLTGAGLREIAAKHGVDLNSGEIE